MKTGSVRFFKESRLTLLMAIPMMAGQVSQMLMGVADTVMVGRVGIVPLAAASFANVIFMALFIVGVGFQIPVSIFNSQAHGRGDEAESGEILRHGLLMALLVGTLVASLATGFSFFIDRFGQEPAVVTEAVPFLRLLAWSLLPAMVVQCIKQFTEALGRPWLPMAIMLSAVLLNVGLNWVLIYGNLGAPALGLVGAGWATLIAHLVSVSTMLACVLRMKIYRAVSPRKWWAPIEWERIRRTIRLGIPLSFSLLLEVSSFGFAAIMMGWLGARSLAAHQIAINCAATTFMFPLGLSFAARIRVGHAVGSGDTDRVRWIGFSAMAIAGILMACFALGMVFFSPVVAGWFVKEADVVAMASSLLLIAAVFQIFDGLQVVAGGSLNGLSDVRVPSLIAFVAYWCIALPLAYYLGFIRHFGGQGIWWALALGLALAALLGISRFWFLTRNLTATRTTRAG